MRTPARAPKRRPFADRARDAAVAFAIEIATDPGEADADVQEARSVVARASADPATIELASLSLRTLRAMRELRDAIREAAFPSSSPADELPRSTHTDEPELPDA